jgi:6-phosphofructokinase
MYQDCCLILESPFYLEGEGRLYKYIEKRLKENGHMVIVVAEGAGCSKHEGNGVRSRFKLARYLF